MELNSFMSDEDTDTQTARAQAGQMDNKVAVWLSQLGSTVFSPAVMKLYAKKQGIEAVMDMFWLRYGDLNDAKKLKRYWLFDPRHKDYLDFILKWSKDRWVAMYNMELLEEVWVKEEEVKPIVVEEKTYLEIKPDAWVDNVKEDELKKKVNLIDFDTLDSKPIEEIWEIRKKTTNRGIWPKVRNDKQWFIKELKKLI